MSYTKESGASLTSIARDIVQGQNLYQSVKSTLDSLRNTDLTGTTASQEFGDKIAAFGQKIEELLRIENKPKIDAVNNEIHNSLRDQIVIQREFVEMQREMQSVLQDLRSLQQQLLYHTT
jgi:chromosome segregation ATPase